MPYCRECNAEFAALLPWCPNCGTPGDEDFDEWEVELMSDDELVPVYNAETEVEALLYRTMLEEAGIDVVERPLEEGWLEGIKQQALHSQLLVRESDAARAGTLVAAFHREADSGELSADIPETTEEEAT